MKNGGGELRVETVRLRGSIIAESRSSSLKDPTDYKELAQEYQRKQGIPKSPNVHQHPHASEIASLWGYIFQIIFQICAGAIMLTDSVFWLILFPLLTPKDYNLDIISMGVMKPPLYSLTIHIALHSQRL
ncbi:hypothetical protein Ahy_B06g083692 [Arachis hypogaea]|uniref:Uncharacterized protein n=1 Tax=Arachis hypogaea TaxID=3818 RepID=A0A444YQ77_ARAHY|nr:hypothetical protein Ahy_B06g083692 [Arachis hypogaea]